MNLNCEDLEKDPVFSGPKHEFRQKLILDMLNLPKGSRVLDAACGVGNLFFKLIKYGYDTTGIDLSDINIKDLMKNGKARGLNVDDKVKKMNVLKMDFPDGSFDGVICGEVLEHIEEDYLVVEELNRVLKKNGVCVVTVPANPKLWDFNDELSGHVRRYNKNQLVKLFEKHGFKVEKINYYGFPLMRFYVKYIYSQMLKKKISNERKNEMINMKIRKFEKLYPLMSYLFYIDKLFNWLPYGIGLIIRGRKI